MMKEVTEVRKLKKIIVNYIFYIKAISYHVTQSYESHLRKYSNVYIQNIDKEKYLWVKEI